MPGIAPKYLGYRDESKLHSETVAYRRAYGLMDKGKPFEVINVRLSHSGAARLAAPCPICSRILLDAGCKELYYSANDEEFVKIKLTKRLKVWCGRNVPPSGYDCQAKSLTGIRSLLRNNNVGSFTIKPKLDDGTSEEALATIRRMQKAGEAPTDIVISFDGVSLKEQERLFTKYRLEARCP